MTTTPTPAELAMAREARVEVLLERIATALEALTGAPVNIYGETFVEAIQNAHERGMRGINTNDR